jgi:chromate transporter
LLCAALGLHARGMWHGLAGIYRAGSLVFGGGHVVLPLLQTAVVAGGDVDAHAFLAAYGLAQAMPGPMFSLAAYLGWHLLGSAVPLASAVLALLAIFLPGLLLAAGVHPWWARLQASAAAASSLSAINCAVTGLLLAALATPIGVTALRAPLDVLIGATGFAILLDRRSSAALVVLWCVAASMLARRFL